MKYIFKNRNLSILFVAIFLFFLSEALFLPTLPLHLMAAGYSNMEIGVILGAFALGVLVFRPLAGYITDHKSRKLSLVLGVLVFCLSPLFYLVSASFAYLLLIRFFHGLGITFFTTAYPPLVTDIVPVERRGEVLGHMATGTTLAFSFGPFSGMAVFSIFGFKALMFTCFFIGIINTIVILLLAEDRLKISSQVRKSFGKIIFKRGVLVSSAINVVNAIIFGGMVTFLPIFLSKIELNVGLFFFIESVSIIACRLIAASLSDRFGRGPVFFYSFLTVLGSVFLVSQITSLHLMIAAAVLFGAGSALGAPALSAFIADEVPAQDRGTAFGIFFGAFDFGVIIAGVLLGYVADLTSLKSMFSYTSFSGLICLGLFALLIKKGWVGSLRWSLVGDGMQKR